MADTKTSSAEFPPFQPPKGPTGIRPLCADLLRQYERLREAHKDLQAAKRQRKDKKTANKTPSPTNSHIKKPSPQTTRIGISKNSTIPLKPNRPREPKVPKTTVTQMTIDIRPQPGVAIAKQLEPAVRGIYSPCGNFIWTESEIARVIDECPGSVLAEGAFNDAVEVLRIGLIHNNANHNGNVDAVTKHRGTQPAFVDDWYDSDNDVSSLDGIMDALVNTMSDVVASIHVVHQHESKLVALSSKETFPNKMGNKDVFPDPWVNKKVKLAKKSCLKDTQIVKKPTSTPPHDLSG